MIYLGNSKIATEITYSIVSISDPSFVPPSRLIFHHTDHLSGANVDTDENGNLLEVLDYYPYGKTRLDDNFSEDIESYANTDYESNYKYTGKEEDEGTGLYYYGARYYNAEVGRFISVDPWSGDISDPQSLNKYSYVRNNPMKYVDPSGQSFIAFAALIGIAIVTAILTDDAEVANAPSSPQQNIQSSQQAPSIAETAQKSAQSYLDNKGLGALGVALSIGYTAYEVGSAAKGIKNIAKEISQVSDDIGLKASNVLQKTLKGNYSTDYLKKLQNSSEWFGGQGLNFSEHALNRVQGLKNMIGITGEDVVNVYKNGDIYYDSVKNNYNRFIDGGNIRLVLDNDTSKVVSVVKVDKGDLSSDRFIKK